MTFKLRNDCNRNFALNCATSSDLTNKRAIGQKAFKRCVELFSDRLLISIESGEQPCSIHFAGADETPPHDCLFGPK